MAATAHAAARVFLDAPAPEPPPADYPLWNLPNVRLLPHLASRTDEALENMEKRLAKMERSVVSVLGLLKKILSLPNVKNLEHKEPN